MGKAAVQELKMRSEDYDKLGSFILDYILSLFGIAAIHS